MNQSFKRENKVSVYLTDDLKSKIESLYLEYCQAVSRDGLLASPVSRSKYIISLIEPVISQEYERQLQGGVSDG